MPPILTALQGMRIVGALAIAAALSVSAAAQTAKYSQTVTVQGFSQPSRLSDVATGTSGVVRKILVREGERVTANQVLVELDDSVHRKRLDLARVTMQSLGDLEAAKAELTAKRTRYERMEELAKREHATVIELLQAQEDFALALAGMQRAEDRIAQQTAEYERLMAEAETYRVRAPFDGVVVKVHKEVGEYVGPGESTLCTVANLDQLTVDFLLPRAYREQIQAEQEITVFFTILRRSVPGVVSYVSPFPQGETNTYTVKVKVDNAAGELSAGERCLLPELDSAESNLTSRRSSD